MYGITETTVHVTFKEITQKEIDLKISNIGKPISSLFGYILDPYFRMVPRGIPGELWIGGQGVSRGYLNRPELTHERFFLGCGTSCTHLSGEGFNAIIQKFMLDVQGVPTHSGFIKDDYSNEEAYNKATYSWNRCRTSAFLSGKRTPSPGFWRLKIYKTGDRVKLLPDGEMEYLGRIDDQVKIRGNRVELGEIEKQMMCLYAIEEAVVIVREDENGDKYLCSYIKITQADQLNISELRRELLKKLPVYMIPAYFITLEKFPLTVTGKIDRKKLPLPPGNRPSLGNSYAPPDTVMAREIVVVWQDILKLEKVGIHDNFFDLGGNSLDIIRLKSRLQELLKREIQIMTFFQYPTIHTFTRHITQSHLTTAVPKEEKPDFTRRLQQGKAKLKARRKSHGIGN
jgi:hypothetical protein